VALPFAAVLVGPDGAVVAANAAALATFNPPGRGLPRTFEAFEAAHLIAGLADAVDEVTRGGRKVSLVGALLDAGGRRAMLDITLAPIHAADGAISAVLVTAVERSNAPSPAAEREQIETLNEELRATNDVLQDQVRQLAEAEAADARKNQFMAMLAHELRNPIGAVVNAVHVIRRVATGDWRLDRALRVAERQSPLGRPSRRIA
jgi:signal transduction histidine kinase